MEHDEYRKTMFQSEVMERMNRQRLILEEVDAGVLSIDEAGERLAAILPWMAPYRRDPADD